MILYDPVSLVLVSIDSDCTRMRVRACHGMYTKHVSGPVSRSHYPIDCEHTGLMTVAAITRGSFAL
jgi:hypothetical protein